MVELFRKNFFANHHHHHHVVPLAWISLTLSRHPSLSFIAFGSSSGVHPVSSHSCCMYVRAGRPAFAWPYVGVHRSTSLMSSSLLLQQSPACLARLTCIVFVLGGKCPYSWCLVGCCHQDLFNIALNILNTNTVEKGVSWIWYKTASTSRDLGHVMTLWSFRLLSRLHWPRSRSKN